MLVLHYFHRVMLALLIILFLTEESFAHSVNIETYGLDDDLTNTLYPRSLEAKIPLLNNKFARLRLRRISKNNLPISETDVIADAEPYTLINDDRATFLVTSRKRKNIIERTLRGQFIHDDTMFSLSGSSGNKNHELRIVENKRGVKSRYKRQQPMVEYHLSLEIFVNTDYFNRATSERELKVYFVNQFIGMDQSFKSLSRTGELRVNLWLNNLHIQKTDENHPIFNVNHELGSTLYSDKNCQTEGDSADQNTCCPRDIQQCFLEQSLLNSLEVYLYRKNLDRQEDNKIDAVQFWTGIKVVSPGSSGRSIPGKSTGDVCQPAEHNGKTAVFGASFLAMSYFYERAYLVSSHELAHSLGAWSHDGSGAAADCARNTSILFRSLPRPNTEEEKREEHRFSTCTIKQIIQRAQIYNCISNYPKCDNNAVVNDLLEEASTELSLDSQCKQLVGEGSTYCGIDGTSFPAPCSWMRCTEPSQSNRCRTQIATRHRNLSPCRSDRSQICQYGICKSRSDVFFPRSAEPSVCQGLVQAAPGGDAALLEVFRNRDSTTSVAPVTDSATVSVTDAPTDSPTDSPTDPLTVVSTDLPSDSMTEAPTESSTDTATEPSTDSSTDSVIDATTESSTDPVTEVSTDSPTVSITDASTESSTDEVTETSTDSSTDSATDAPTEPLVESTTQPTQPTTTARYVWRTSYYKYYRVYYGKNCGGYSLYRGQKPIYGLNECKRQCNRYNLCSGFNFNWRYYRPYCYLRRGCNPRFWGSNTAYKKETGRRRERVRV